MQRPAPPTALIRDGEAQTEYNSNLLTTFRLDDLMKKANYCKNIFSYEGTANWLVQVQCLDDEICGLLNEEENSALETVRVRNIPLIAGKENVYFLLSQRKRIIVYERAVRRIIQLKGLGVTAKLPEVPGAAILK